MAVGWISWKLKSFLNHMKKWSHRLFHKRTIKSIWIIEILRVSKRENQTMGTKKINFRTWTIFFKSESLQWMWNEKPFPQSIAKFTYIPKNLLTHSLAPNWWNYIYHDYIKKLLFICRGFFSWVWVENKGDKNEVAENFQFIFGFFKR